MPPALAPLPPAPAPSPVRLGLHLPVLAVAYVLAAWLGHALSPPAQPFVSFWLPSGLYLAALLLHPTRAWPALVLAAVASNALFDSLNGQSLAVVCLFSLANSTEALTGAWLIRRFVAARPAFESPGEVLRFVVLAVAFAPMVGATVGATTVVALLGGDSFAGTWLMWWSGDATGVLLVAPIVLGLAGARWRHARNVSPLRVLEFLAILATIGTAGWFAIDRELRHGLGLKYVAIPFVVLAVVRFRIRGGSLAILLVGLIYAFHSARISGMDAASRVSPAVQTVSLQLFLAVLGVTALALGALLEERRRRAAALLESRALLHSVVEGTTDAVYVKDRAGRYLLFNSAAARVVGKTTAEVLGRDDTFLFPPAEAQVVMQEDQISMTAAEARTYEERITDAAGEPRVFLSTKGPLRNAAGEPIGLFGIARDITERKRTEAQRESMARKIDQKNQEMENLVYVTSHDLRSPLLNIQGFSQRLRQAGTDIARAAATPEWDEKLRREVSAIAGERIPQALGFIQTSVEKMSHLIDGLLRLSRLGRAGMQPERLNLNDLLATVCSGLAHQIQTAGAAVEVGPLPPCTGDATLLNQLFTNLLDNAVKYRDPARPLRVRIAGRIERTDTVYEVADNGTGIPPVHLEKIWDLFHRVDPSGPVPGEGLGLSLVRRIVERHGGEIRVESTVGEGSRFVFRLPAGGPENPENA